MGWRALAVFLLCVTAASVAVRRLTADPSDALVDLLHERASAEFSGQVRDYMDWTLPRPVLLDLREHDYRLEVNSSTRQGRWFVDETLDQRGGVFYSGFRAIVVAEKVRSPWGWSAAYDWRNAVGHEVGHAVSSLIGGGVEDPYLRISASSEFAAAYDADLADIPPWLLSEKLPDGGWNRLHYFVEPDRGGRGHERAREEAFAESFDVLLRGGYAPSAELFHEYFPRTLEATRAIVERRYGRVFAHDPVREAARR